MEQWTNEMLELIFSLMLRMSGYTERELFEAIVAENRRSYNEITALDERIAHLGKQIPSPEAELSGLTIQLQEETAGGPLIQKLYTYAFQRVVKSANLPGFEELFKEGEAPIIVQPRVKPWIHDAIQRQFEDQIRNPRFASQPVEEKADGASE